MKLETSISLNVPISPREKPNYEDISNGEKLITFLLADDFQENIKHEIRIALHNSSNAARFPISGSVSICLDIYSNPNTSLIGVAKNVLDACNGILFTDDKHVASMLIRRFPRRHQQCDSLDIKILSSRVIRQPIISSDIVDSSSVFSISIDTIVEDRYLPYPPRAAATKIINNNTEQDTSMRESLQQLYQGSIHTGRLGISLYIDTSTNEGDIDNMAQQCLFNSQGVLFENATEIELLHIIKKTDPLKKSSIEIFTLS